MRKNTIIQILIAIAALILVEQYVTYGVFFSISDIHHETASVALVAAALALYLYHERRAKN